MKPTVDPRVLRVAARLSGAVLMVCAEIFLKDKLSADVYGKVLALGSALFFNTILSWNQVNVDELEKLSEPPAPPAN